MSEITKYKRCARAEGRMLILRWSTLQDSFENCLNSVFFYPCITSGWLSHKRRWGQEVGSPVPVWANWTDAWHLEVISEFKELFLQDCPTRCRISSSAFSTWPQTAQLHNATLYSLYETDSLLSLNTSPVAQVCLLAVCVLMHKVFAMPRPPQSAKLRTSQIHSA